MRWERGEGEERHEIGEGRGRGQRVRGELVCVSAEDTHPCTLHTQHVHMCTYFLRCFVSRWSLLQPSVLDKVTRHTRQQLLSSQLGVLLCQQPYPSRSYGAVPLKDLLQRNRDMHASEHTHCNMETGGTVWRWCRARYEFTLKNCNNVTQAYDVDICTAKLTAPIPHSAMPCMHEHFTKMNQHAQGTQYTGMAQQVKGERYIVK